MDIHPLVVHYPIALLTLYSLFELVSVRKMQERPYWFYVKAVFVILGALGAVASAVSGLFATHFVRGVPLVEMHIWFSYATAAIFLIIAALYASVWWGNAVSARYSAKILFNRWAMAPLALVGLVSIVITGGLGGAMVYGTDFDPLMRPIFKLLDVY